MKKTAQRNDETILFRSEKNTAYGSEQEEFDVSRAQVQRTVLYASDTDIVDFLYQLTKTCEIRALLCVDNPRLRLWYSACERILYGAMVLISRLPEGIKPHKNLSNDALYWPDMQDH